MLLKDEKQIEDYWQKCFLLFHSCSFESIITSILQIGLKYRRENVISLNISMSFIFNNILFVPPLGLKTTEKQTNAT